jgi:nucleoside-diphosphate-sugar epimerase
MSTALVTGGAGFIGRWVVEALLAEGRHVVVVDDFSSGSPENLAGLACPRLDVVEGSIDDAGVLDAVFGGGVDLCLHLAARINVQQSIDDPVGTYVPDVLGTLLVLERSRVAGAPFLFTSSCMVYAAAGEEPIAETHATRPASPYAASKLAGEQLTLAYGLAYGHPVTVVRPFNTYGPFQRADGEGGVVAIFCRRALAGEEIEVFGDGTQTRDLLYAADCAEFLVRAAGAEAARGEVVNAGTGCDVAVRDLAELVAAGRVPWRHARHPHPQAEIRRLRCDPSKAERVLGWRVATTLEDGIARTNEWLARTRVAA